MLVTEAIDLMRRRLTRATAASTELNNWILAEMNAAQLRLEGQPTLPWFLLTEEAYKDLAIGEERLLLPDDFIRENETDNLQLEETETGTFHELTKQFFDDLRKRYGDTAGIPKGYTITGGYYRLRPIPDKSTYRAWMTYFAHDIVLLVGGTNLWLTYMPDLLISEAGVVLATALRNDQALNLYSNMRTEQLGRLTRENVAREMDNFEPNPED